MAADHFSSVQYPHIRPLGRQPAKQPFFRYQMPWYKRLELLVISLAGASISLILLGAVCLLIWCFGSAALGY